MMRYSELSKEERIALRNAFSGFKGEDKIPEWPVVETPIQEMLSDSYVHAGVPQEPLYDLFAELGLDELAGHVNIPGSQEDLTALTGCETLVWERLAQEYGSRAGHPDSLSRIQARLAAIYESLATGPHVDDDEVVAPDLVVVFGGRRRAAEARANLAAEVVGSQQESTDVRVIMSGWHPYYDSRFTFGGEGGAYLPFGEAEAMAVTFEERLGNWDVQPFKSNPLLPRLVLDPRARNTVETVLHSLPVVVETWRAKRRPLNICLITSPYHVRRTYNIATVQYDHMLHSSLMISRITCRVSASGLGRLELINRDSPLHEQAVHLYVRESVKLIGGRLTGEF